LVIAANAVAWPIAYYAMSRWLESFVYRVDFNVGTFLVAGALVLATAGSTVALQAFRAARANPVEALRYE
jgi:putative ABC transport system permease protein